MPRLVSDLAAGAALFLGVEAGQPLVRAPELAEADSAATIAPAISGRR